MHRLKAEGIIPSQQADPATLVRRVYLDVTGMPPTPFEVDEYLRDQRPDAYARLVERLLASPRYGERTAAYWLDLVHYANSVGYHGDQEHAISFDRDWIIRSFMENMPWDEFTRAQRAGDLLAASVGSARPRSWTSRSPPATTACYRHRTRAACAEE